MANTTPGMSRSRQRRQSPCRSSSRHPTSRCMQSKPSLVEVAFTHGHMNMFTDRQQGWPLANRHSRSVRRVSTLMTNSKLPRCVSLIHPKFAQNGRAPARPPLKPQHQQAQRHKLQYICKSGSAKASEHKARTGNIKTRRLIPSPRDKNCMSPHQNGSQIKKRAGKSEGQCQQGGPLHTSFGRNSSSQAPTQLQPR